MSPAAAKRFRLLASAVSVLALLAALAAGWFYFRMRASLPQLDGAAAIAGLGANVTITRDALGVPTVKAESRADVARALGWLHAQDRFFQMDLLRRRSAGELAELFGKAALLLDRDTRRHGFRALAEKILAQTPAEQRALLEAYTAGANAGLAALGEKPFEYLLLRETPKPWSPTDTLLVSFTMWLDLEDSHGRYEHTLMTLRDQFGAESLAFFAPQLTPADAALDGTTAPAAPPPGPGVIDLRKRLKTTTAIVRPRPEAFFAAIGDEHATDIGSNAFALAGAHTATGAGLLANDMHLGLAVPNIWYRASLEFPGHKITGTSLPGTPIVTNGSNGHVAWGFTVGYTDSLDLVVIERVPGSHSLYRGADHDTILEIERRKELIRIRGEKPAEVTYDWTVWGPIVGENDNHHPLAAHWIAYEPSATNLSLIDLENATDAKSAVEVVHRAGIQHLNFVVADSAGQIAWSATGLLPHRIGYDGRLPVNWAFGDRKWDGFVPPAEMPAVIAPPGGRVWSSNQRAVGGAALALLGDGGPARPARAMQVRDDLALLEKATPRDLLAIQLDDRALFLARWQKLLLETLTPASVAQKNSRAELRTLVEKWDGRASVESVSYRLVRAFREAVRTRMWTPVFQSCIEADDGFAWARLDLEAATWTLLREKPAHLLSSEFATWDDLLVAAADSVVDEIAKQGVPLDRATWGARNIARIQHPLARVLPAWLCSWLNMPADPLPGDVDMPRVQGNTFGASERFVVSPGHEAEGIFHMPGGQSGHPLSPFFRAGHTAWVRGDPTPFLPGATEHTLILAPR
jgi:penicillin amidase